MSSSNLIHLFQLLLLCPSIYCNVVDVNSREALCSKGIYKSLDVEEAFRYNDYIGLFGAVNLVEDMKNYQSVFLMVKYITDFDPSDPESHHFYEADVWPALKDGMALFKENNNTKVTKYIRYAFSANAQVLPGQDSGDVVFVVYQDFNGKYKNVTKAYDFFANHTLKRDLMVFNPESNQDLSQAFNLKLLFLHFPEGVDIFDIVILNIKTNKKNAGNYFALVYTQEMVNNQTLKMVHFLTTTTHSIQHYELIEWQFDTRRRQCHKLEAMPSAVVWAKTDTSMPNNDESSVIESQRPIYNITLIEFFGPYNHLVSLTIDQELGVLEYKPIGDKRPNLKILNCEKHPAYAIPTPIDCATEKIKERAVPDLELYEQTSENDEHGFNGFLIIAVLMIIIGIIIVIALGISMLFYSSHEYK